jgi:N-acetylneuraminate synthase
MITELEINGRKVGPKQEPYIIAEMSANHNGSFERAEQLLVAAAATGVDAVKMQTYTPDTITLNSDAPEFCIDEGLWKGRTLYDLYAEAFTPWDWHKPLFERARELDVTLFSSPFDTTAVDLLEDLNAPAYKIASFEAIDLPLIRYVASTGKPMIISTGMANVDEIGEAVETARNAGCNQLALLHCVSGYPAPASHYNLKTVAELSERFGVVSGLSDHTLDTATAVAAVALGASVIEKHFTLDRSANGPDDSFSLEPDQFKALCEDAKTAWAAVGEVNFDRTASELGNVRFRRSLYVTRDIKKGDVFDASNVRSVRPGYGLAPKNYDDVIGKRCSKDIAAASALDWDMVER